MWSIPKFPRRKKPDVFISKVCKHKQPKEITGQTATHDDFMPSLKIGERITFLRCPRETGCISLSLPQGFIPYPCITRYHKNSPVGTFLLLHRDHTGQCQVHLGTGYANPVSTGCGGEIFLTYLWNLIKQVLSYKDLRVVHNNQNFLWEYEDTLFSDPSPPSESVQGKCWFCGIRA
jgi:hypothetical protein